MPSTSYVVRPLSAIATAATIALSTTAASVA
jgi:hypothetical protein